MGRGFLNLVLRRGFYCVQPHAEKLPLRRAAEVDR